MGFTAERLFIQKKDGKDMFVVKYKDVFGNPFESSREYILEGDKSMHKLGPLEIC